LPILVAKLSQTCYAVCGELTPYALQKSSVLRWLQKQDDDGDKSQTADGREFQAAGPQTAKLHDPHCDSQERGIIRSAPKDAQEA